MGKTEYIAFRATPTERQALEQLAQRTTQGNLSLMLRELVVKEAISCGVLPTQKKNPSED